MSDVAPHLRPALDALRHVFAGGVPDEEYLALLAALDESFSNRGRAEVVPALTGRHPIDVDNDHANAVSSHRPPAELVEAIARRLRAVGLLADDG
ncbi:MAG TPA: hypothetical protein VF230_10155 [Acidimicrobiales bacterium]